MIKGLSVVREDNGSEKDYHKFVDSEDMGLIVFTLLKITDPQ